MIAVTKVSIVNNSAGGLPSDANEAMARILNRSSGSSAVTNSSLLRYRRDNLVQSEATLLDSRSRALSDYRVPGCADF